MKAIVTGLNGTVAPYVKEALEQQHIEVIPWNREIVDANNHNQIQSFLESTHPDFIFHLAMGSIEWTEQMALYAKDHVCKFVFTSTESVFQGSGPFTLTSTPNAESDYGKYKIESERRIRLANPNSYIVRLGWQVGDQFAKNNMLNFLETLYQKQGFIEASTKWVLATCFIKETAKWIVKIAMEMDGDTYQIEGNDGLSFYELVKLIEHHYHKDWHVIPVDQPIRDNRLVDPRINPNTLREILK